MGGVLGCLIEPLWGRNAVALVWGVPERDNRIGVLFVLRAFFYVPTTAHRPS